MELLGLLAVPVLIASLAWVVARDTITRGEFFAQLLISAALLSAAWSFAKAKTLDDAEHLNDYVTTVEHFFARRIVQPQPEFAATTTIQQPLDAQFELRLRF